MSPSADIKGEIRIVLLDASKGKRKPAVAFDCGKIELCHGPWPHSGLLNRPRYALLAFGPPWNTAAAATTKADPSRKRAEVR
jgi:hypothetical protein